MALWVIRVVIRLLIGLYSGRLVMVLFLNLRFWLGLRLRMYRLFGRGLLLMLLGLRFGRIPLRLGCLLGWSLRVFDRFRLRRPRRLRVPLA